LDEAPNDPARLQFLNGEIYRTQQVISAERKMQREEASEHRLVAIRRQQEYLAELRRRLSILFKKA
jgi:hypothetical protein